jgi:hypothetical protein
MWQPGALSRTVLALIWLVLGLAMVTVPVWLGWTRWPAILNGQPAMLIAGLACGLAGLIAGAWAIGTLTVGARLDREGDADHPAHRTSSQVQRRSRRRIIIAVPLLVLSFLLVLALVYARPFVATPTAVTALRSEKGVRLSDRLGWYELVPAKQDADDWTGVRARGPRRFPCVRSCPSSASRSRLPRRRLEGAIRLRDHRPQPWQ